MKLRNKVVVLTASWLLVACSSQRPATTDPLYASLRSISSPKRQLYQSVRDAGDWRNPYLVVCADGVDVRGIGGRVLPEELASILARLPKEAWPYGRIVAVQEIGIRSGGDDELIRDNLTKVLRILREIGIEVELWPSA